jgi:hypothetical protein
VWRIRWVDSTSKATLGRSWQAERDFDRYLTITTSFLLTSYSCFPSPSDLDAGLRAVVTRGAVLPERSSLPQHERNLLLTHRYESLSLLQTQHRVGEPLDFTRNYPQTNRFAARPQKPPSKGLWKAWHRIGASATKCDNNKKCTPEEHVCCMRSVNTAYRTFPVSLMQGDTALLSPMEGASLIRSAEAWRIDMNTCTCSLQEVYILFRVLICMCATCLACILLTTLTSREYVSVPHECMVQSDVQGVCILSGNKSK